MTVYPVGIVGESHCQAAIRRARVGDPIVIWHEADNKHDPRALRVDDAAGARLGYVARDSWLHAAVIDERKRVSARIGSIGPAPGGLLGVVLDVSLGTEFPPPRTAGRNRSSVVPQETKGLGCLSMAALTVVVMAVLGQCSSSIDSTADVAAIIEPLPEATRQQCRDLLSTAERENVIRRRNGDGRIDVEDGQWAMLPADLKQQLMAAVGCADYGMSASALVSARDLDAVRLIDVYGYRSGRLIARYGPGGADFDP